MLYPLSYWSLTKIISDCRGASSLRLGAETWTYMQKVCLPIWRIDSSDAK